MATKKHEKARKGKRSCSPSSLRAFSCFFVAIPEIPCGRPRYRVVGPLGSGGMGVVYRAEHRLMERPVALKVIRRDLLADPTAVERFRQEVKAAARLAHRNIVTAHDADEAGGLHLLVME